VTVTVDLRQFEAFAFDIVVEVRAPGGGSPMAVWVLCRAFDVLAILPHDRRREICERLGLGAEEIGLRDQVHELRAGEPRTFRLA